MASNRRDLECFAIIAFSVSNLRLEISSGRQSPIHKGKHLYLELQQQLIQRVRDLLKRQYDVELPRIVVDQPPNVGLGEYALPLSFELAKKLRKPPRKIAEEIVAGLGEVPGFEKFEVAGAGYINARLNREEAAPSVAGRGREAPDRPRDRKFWSSTPASIPTRQRISGTCATRFWAIRSFVCCRPRARRLTCRTISITPACRWRMWWLAFFISRKRGRPTIEALIAASGPPPRSFDYYCWDLYARVSQWYEESKDNLKLRLQTLHDIEKGGNEAAEIGKLISNAIIRRHLETMQRLGIEYDFLPQESEILHLHFWEVSV